MRVIVAILGRALVPLAIMLLAWQPLPLAPATELTSSWGAGLEMAIHNGITFGDHVVFTYGPLGFLSLSQLWYGHLGELAFAYAILIRFGLAAALFVGARQTFGGPAAFLIASVVASVDSQLGEAVLALIFAVWAITRELERSRTLALTLAAGAFAGVQLLNKTSVGISLVAMTTVLVLSLPGRRREQIAAACAGMAVTLFGFWAATGQDFGALPDYARNTARVVSGYAAAMSFAEPGLGWQSMAAVLGLALGLWGALHTTAIGTSRQRRGVVVLWIVFWFFAFKEGFVRHDAQHALIFFDAVLGGFFAFRWRASHRTAALASAAALVTFALVVQSTSLVGDFDPSANVSSALSQLGDVTSVSKREAIMAAGRAQIVAKEPIDPQSLSLLERHTVDVYPLEIALAWAYRLDWDPLPVLQSYSAYTPGLDQIDSDALASARAPQRILVQPIADIDGRVPSFDEPKTIRMILCRYRQMRTTPTLAVLGLGSDRCSAPRPLSTVRADWGQTVPVPPVPSHSLVLVQIRGVGVTGLERLTALLYKPDYRFVRLDGGSPHRLVTGTAADGLPLAASPGIDFAPPYNIAPGARTIAVTKAGGAAGNGRPITYSFYAQSISAGPLSPPLG